MTTKMRAAMSLNAFTRHVQGSQVPQPRRPRNEFFSNARWWPTATGALAVWIAVAGLMAASGPMHAQTSEAAGHAGHAHHADHGASADAPATAASAPASPSTVLSEGEVVRWNAATRRITLRHGELRNLDMPPMTMVFRVRETPADAVLVPGARVRFLAERDVGGFAVSRIEPAGR
ncbi:copper-binding protein [Acidovorax sp. PRC11]|uniref:copper-binding protein n=1 Tax=Acidovorax sp. PRC11 TaxID=2962592 RepID=UPI0028810443|nr:copper-binding protein [Acidovorax sp. PRC11]MDT0138140.1 copper-binding protein [Acidovorax sp. PRC11]